MERKHNPGLYLILLLLCIAVICSAGCSQTATVYTFTEDDNGKTFNVGMDDIVKVSLFSNPTTGYEWNVDTTGNLVITNVEFISDSAEGMIGAGRVQEWTLAANAPGTYEFNAVYKRSWEDTDADMSYQLTLIFQ